VGIGTARYLPSIHLQPYMRERYRFREGLCPVAEDASRRTFALPFHTALAAEDQDHVVEVLRGALERAQDGSPKQP
jgi:perosamine synthetase